MISRLAKELDKSISELTKKDLKKFAETKAKELNGWKGNKMADLNKSIKWMKYHHRHKTNIKYSRYIRYLNPN